MWYTETDTYVGFVHGLNAEISEIAARIVILEGVPRGTPKAADERARLRSLIKSRETKKEKAEDLTCFSLFELLQMLYELEHTRWTTEEAALWNSERSAHEGRGEKGLKLRLGLPQTSSLESGDLGVHGEVKNLQAAAGKTVQTIQVGKVGKQQYGMLLMRSAEVGLLKGLSEDVRMSIAFGEVTSGMIYSSLPAFMQELYKKVLAPSNVLRAYVAIWGATEFGFVRVPRAAYDEAWRLVSVTKGSPRYMLRREYIENRLKAFSPATSSEPAA